VLHDALQPDRPAITGQGVTVAVVDSGVYYSLSEKDFGSNRTRMQVDN
jgi:hypothetical protein